MKEMMKTKLSLSKLSRRVKKDNEIMRAIEDAYNRFKAAVEKGNLPRGLPSDLAYMVHATLKTYGYEIVRKRKPSKAKEDEHAEET